ncbi:MAG TPA: NAD-dependent succinate-semialdehyde dehydrogenase [Candidatus Nitrosocosmicus sp.]|nr:NAD-dependent succinate-semialdehyde dehydrogenase [Candidatus Nitrosocosmicus sp.]
MISSVNPATEETIATYETMSFAEAARVVAEADRAFHAWRRLGFKERAKPMQRAGALLEERKDALALLMAREMGKPIAQGISEAEKCAWVCRHYAEHAHSFLVPEELPSDAAKSYAAFQPLGVVLGVMPWNFPFWQVFRFAAPTLMAGNACVLKHASNVTGCALAIGDLFRDAGFPEGLFGVLLVPGDQVARVIEMPLVRAVSLTGSSAAGRSVAREAGRVLKKCVLELGGSDPYVVLEDADLGSAVETCVSSRLINGGQSCIAAKRFIVVRPLERAFTESMVQLMREKTQGLPTEPGVDLGPLARRDLRDQLHAQVTESVRRGAVRALGGTVPPGHGAFYPPTVLTSVRPGMPAYDEETFGPVAAIITADDEADAIRIANDSPFGLGAAVFTKDRARGERIAAEEFEAGACFVNAFVRSDPRLPFGGVKDSGYGRELSSFGIREFVNIKTVYVA